jgi:hypothetical protein
MKSGRVGEPSLFFFSWGWLFFFLILWEILLLAQNPGLMSDDSGEIAASAYGLGLCHPPAYPFFNLLGHLACWLPVGTVAFRLNLLSEFFVLASLGIILITCRKMVVGLPTLSSGSKIENLLLVAVGIIFISCRSIFAQSLTAKGGIYTFTLLLTSLVVLLRLLDIRRPSSKFLFLAIFIWAVGMGSHWQTQILWTPFLLFWLCEKKLFFHGRTIIFLISTVLMGLSTYLYLPLRAVLNCLPSWGYPIHLHLFYWVVSRQLVAGTEPWVQNFSFYFESILGMLRTAFLYWLPGFVFLVLIGMRRLWIEEKGITLSLLLLFGPVFSGVLAIHQQKNIYLIPAYLVPLAGLMVVFGFFGFRSLLALTDKKKDRWMMALFLTFISSEWLIHVFRVEDKNGYLLAEDFGENVMKPLPKGSILLADGDHYVMPIWYEKYVNQKRSDLIFEPSIFLLHGWGWKQLADQSNDLEPVGTVLSLFQDRLDFLTHFPLSHPLYYSVSMQYLEPALAQMPGNWVSNGLTDGWESHKPASVGTKKRLFQTMKDQRLRGLDYGVKHVLDPSSADIYRYYDSQSF